ncbi:hypothetical protein E2542_SST27439 [Spatholobus suberectus]|nr:hypothetical protein E2542_SST27439 [Spatholobus suberectus]
MYGTDSESHANVIATVWFVTIFKIVGCPHSWTPIEGKILSMISSFVTRPLQIRTFACPGPECQDHSRLKFKERPAKC